MPIIIIETQIDVPPEVCFDLVRHISLHLQTAKNTDEKAVVGRTNGKISLGETATFEGKHFGFTQKLTVKITEFEKPFRFVDEMTEGAFKSFKHIHEFIPLNDGTLMRDTLRWTSPFGVLGRIADELLLKNHLRKFVTRRNTELKQIAEKFTEGIINFAEIRTRDFAETRTQ
ncbi:MAG: SRPBCC family protein [Pyrinomonadaceae bacterium]